MLQFIDIDQENSQNLHQSIDRLNAAAKQAHDHPETHGLLVKIYAKWCGHCQNTAADWDKVIHELKTNYKCKKPGCVLTVASVEVKNLDNTDPVIQGMKHIPKDIHGVPTIMYVSKGKRGLEYSNNRVYSEMLNWIIHHPHFGLVRKDSEQQPQQERPLHRITKNARTKFKLFHRKTLKRFHEKMRRRHQKSVKSRMATPSHKTGHIPAYLR